MNAVNAGDHFYNFDSEENSAKWKGVLIAALKRVSFGWARGVVGFWVRRGRTGVVVWSRLLLFRGCFVFDVC